MRKYFKPESGSRQDSGALAKKQEAERMAAMQQALRRDQTAAPVMPMSPSSAQQQADDRHAQKAALPHLQSSPRKAAAAAAVPQGRRAVQSSAGRVSRTLLEEAAAALEFVSSDTVEQVAPPRAAQRRSSVPAAAAAAAVADAAPPRALPAQPSDQDLWSCDDSGEEDVLPFYDQEQVEAALRQAGVKLLLPDSASRAGRNRDAYLTKIQPSEDELPPPSDERQGLEDEPWLPPIGVAVGTTAEAHPDAREKTAALSQALKLVCDEAVLYALKTHCVPVEQGQWSPADLALVRAALGVWAIGISDSLLRDLLSLAAVLGNVCLGADCDDTCHLARYMAAHVQFCKALRAVHPVVHSMEGALAYIASTGASIAGAMDASAATKANMGYAPDETKWGRAGQARMAAEGLNEDGKSAVAVGLGEKAGKKAGETRAKNAGQFRWEDVWPVMDEFIKDTGMDRTGRIDWAQVEAHLRPRFPGIPARAFRDGCQARVGYRRWKKKPSESEGEGQGQGQA